MIQPLYLCLLVLWPGHYDFEAHLEKIEACPSFDSAHVGSAGVASENYAEFKKLLKRASKEQLLSAMEHSSPMVRAFANRALYERYPTDWVPLGIRQMDDQAVITTFQGCMVQHLKLSELYLRWLEQNITTLVKENPEDPIASELRINVLDFLFSQAIPNSNLEHILSEWDLPEAYYDHVRELTHMNQREAFVALAKFQKPQDAPIILDFLDKNQTPSDQRPFALRAATLLPHASYHDTLSQLHQQTLLESSNPYEHRLFFKALIANLHPDAAAMMLTTIQAAKDNHISSLQLSSMHDALIEAKNLDIAQFQEVLFELWQSKGYLKNYHFDELWDLDPGRCIHVLESIVHRPSPSIAQYGYHFSATHVAAAIQASGRDRHLDLLNQMIGMVTIFDLPTYLPIVLKARDPATLPFLIKNLEQADHPITIEWTIIGIRHLKPENYKKIVKDMIELHPEWEDMRLLHCCDSKTTHVKRSLRKATPLARAIKQHQSSSRRTKG